MVEIGAIVEGVVVKVMEYGAIVKLDSGESGMVHISQVDKNYVKNIGDHVRENDRVTVKVVGQKEDGKIDLSMKQAEPGYEPMGPSYDGAAFRAAHALVFEGLTQPSGYTEPILHRSRRAKKLEQS